MSVLWIRPVTVEHLLSADERRIRDFVDTPSGVSESAQSLGQKLGIGARRCRRILDGLVEQGIVRRRDFVDMDPLYVRFPSR